MGFLALGLGAGFGIGAWRNVGPVEGATRSALVLFMVGVGLVCYLAGRARSRRGASAVSVSVAVAKAQARSSAAAVGNQVLVVNGAAGGAGARFAALDSMPWANEHIDFDAQDAAAIEQGGDDLDPAEVLWGRGAPRASEAARRPLPGEPPGSGVLWVPGS